MMGLSKIAGTFFSWLSKSAGIFLKNKNVFMPRMMRLSKIAGTFFSWLSKSARIFLKNNVFTLPRMMRLSKIAGIFQIADFGGDDLHIPYILHHSLLEKEHSSNKTKQEHHEVLQVGNLEGGSGLLAYRMRRRQRYDDHWGSGGGKPFSSSSSTSPGGIQRSGT